MLAMIVSHDCNTSDVAVEKVVKATREFSHTIMMEMILEHKHQKPVAEITVAAVEKFQQDYVPDESAFINETQGVAYYYDVAPSIQYTFIKLM